MQNLILRTKEKYINQGIVRNQNISRFLDFIKNSSKYLPFLSNSEYIGSFYTVRTILPNLEKTDERTGDVNYIDNKYISIFSSKWNSCISTAYKINNLIKDKNTFE